MRKLRGAGDLLAGGAKLPGESGSMDKAGWKLPSPLFVFEAAHASPRAASLVPLHPPSFGTGVLGRGFTRDSGLPKISGPPDQGWVRLL